MRHVLVSSARPELVEGLRLESDASTVFLEEHGVDETLERLGRSARVDAVVTDDPDIVAAIRDEIPGHIPVHLAAPGEEASETLAELSRLLES